MSRFRTLGGGFALALLALGLRAAVAGEDAGADEPAVFEMEEVSVFDIPENRLVRGQYAECQREPDQQVTAYPKLKSERPLYGKVTFEKDYYVPDSGTVFHFVLDESGEPLPGADQEPEETEAEQGSSLLESLSEALSGPERRRPSPPKPTVRGTYDRLYFDLNRDLDLTNDPVLRRMENPPSQAIPQGDAKQRIVFDYLTVQFDHGPDLGARPLQMIPRFILNEREEREYPYLYFAATKARKGKIRIGSREYVAVLAQPYVISGRLDRPYTRLQLEPVAPGVQQGHWWGVDALSAIRRVDGKFYTVSATPTGDKLTVSPFQGDFGVLEIGPGNRQIEEVSIRGSLRSGTAAVALGNPSDDSWDLKAVRKCRVPVGDYLPALVSINYGTLRLSVSNNYHSDGAPRDSARPRVLAIKIRKDKPYVWDFSNEPEVIFASPANDQTFTPGDEIEVKAVLTDPELDIMIRGLDDTRRKEERTYTLSSGDTGSYETARSLDPIVTITDSSGNQVAEGKMPFG